MLRHSFALSSAGLSLVTSSGGGETTGASGATAPESIQCVCCAGEAEALVGEAASAGDAGVSEEEAARKECLGSLYQTSAFTYENA